MAKKTAKKASAALVAAKKRLRYWDDNVPDEFAFVVRDGKVLKSLKDVVKAMEQINDDIFGYHANKEKNDFSNWIRDVMHYHDLAHNILGKNRLHTKETILLYVKKKAGRV